MTWISICQLWRNYITQVTPVFWILSGTKWKHLHMTLIHSQRKRNKFPESSLLCPSNSFHRILGTCIKNLIKNIVMSHFPTVSALGWTHDLMTAAGGLMSTWGQIPVWWQHNRQGQLLYFRPDVFTLDWLSSSSDWVRLKKSAKIAFSLNIPLKISWHLPSALWSL